MLGVKYLLSLSLLSALIHSGKSHGGSSDWSGVCLSGKRQSPIDIPAKGLVHRHRSPHSLQFVNYNEPASHLRIRKHGRDVDIDGSWEGKKKPTVTGDVLSNQTYAFYDAHVHWSAGDDNGTEHSIDGQRYATELHAVHVNVKYPNLAEALNHPDGLAVVGVLFKVDDHAPHSRGVERNFEYLSATPGQGSDDNEAAKSLFDFSAFLPRIAAPSFFQYDGSLTTPPCTENVQWIVLAKPRAISSTTMRLLRLSSSRVTESGAVRPRQPLNGRAIKRYA